MEDDEGVNFESGRSFISIGLPARTSFAIRLAGDIPVGLAWREAERRRQRCGAASDRTDRNCRRTGDIVVTNGRSGVRTAAEHANTHTARHIAVSIDLGGVEIGSRRRPV